MNDNQFDSRYSTAPRYVDNPGARKRSRYSVARQREIQTALRHRPSNISYFQGILEEMKIPDGVKVVGYLCNMIPEEIIIAMGAVPARLGCGNAALVQSGEEVLSGEVCPLAKSSFAMFLDEESASNKVDCIIIPTSCDAKKKLGEVLADYKPVFMLNLPPEQDYKRYWKQATAELKRLAEFLGKRLGVKLRKRELLKAIELNNKRTRIVRELQDARAEKPEALSIRDLFIVIQSYNEVPDREKWCEEAQKLLAELKAFAPDRKSIRPRLVLTGAPIIWPNFKPLNLIEECGAVVVADTLCTGVQSAYDPVVVDEKGVNTLLRALAQRYIFGSACPCFISSATKTSRVLDLVDEYRADGVIHYGLRLCQLFDIEVYKLSMLLKSRKIPFTIMRTDYSLEDTEQLRVRLEAFLETIEDR